MPGYLVIIPTYNEIENIERMVRTVLSLDPPFHLLIVDDGSPDGTSVKIKELMKLNDDLEEIKQLSLISAPPDALTSFFVKILSRL